MTQLTPPFANIFQRIEDFNHRIVLGGPREPNELTQEDLIFLSEALQEEAEELLSTREVVDPSPSVLRASQQVDALVDCCIFAIGGLVRMGVDARGIQDAFDAVMDANFQKKSGVNPNKSRSLSGAKDVTKPENFKGPEDRLRVILEDLGFPPPSEEGRGFSDE